jgi:nucleoside-diphosphate-sugar epimerase
VPSAFVTGGSGFIGGALIRRLLADGWDVRALARSDAAAAKVRAHGAQDVSGDLDDPAALRAGAEGCEYAFHAAAKLGEWGARREFEQGNVAGTENVLRGCHEAGVRRFVHVGTEAALLAGEPLIEVDERAPLRFDSKALYSATKARAEAAVLAAAGPVERVVVRPRLVWGSGDTTILPALVDAVRSGRFAWIAGGRHLTSTTHVDNVVEGLVLGARRGASGSVYFVTDGAPVVFREFITRLLATQGVEVPSRSIPRPVAAMVAAASEAAWSALPLPGGPPLTRLAYWLAALETTIDISRARTELGYRPVRTIDSGMRELAGGAGQPAPQQAEVSA